MKQVSIRTTEVEYQAGIKIRKTYIFKTPQQVHLELPNYILVETASKTYRIPHHNVLDVEITE